MLKLISTLSLYLLIIFEIIFTVFCVKKLLSFEKYIDEIHVKMLEGAKRVLEINDEVQATIKKINKIIKAISNKKFHQIKRIIMTIADIVQIIVLLKTLNIKKGIKEIDFKVLRKLAVARVSSQIVKKLLDFAQNLCAI